MPLVGNIDYGSWKDGSSIFKDVKGYYIVQFDIVKRKEYKKYLKNWRPPRDNESSSLRLYTNKKSKKWITRNKRGKRNKTKKTNKINKRNKN